MVAEKDLQHIVKKTKFHHTKEVLKAFIAEDPLLTFALMGLFSTFYPIFLTFLAQAIYQNNIEMIYIILFAITGFTVGLIVPLSFARTRTLTKMMKAKAEEKATNDFYQLKKFHEQQKQKRLNHIMDARIKNINSQTNFIMNCSSDFVSRTMRQKAQTLQADFSQENIHATMSDIVETLGTVITRFNTIDQQYEQAYDQIEKICNKLAIDIEDFKLEPIIRTNQTTDGLNKKFEDILDNIPNPSTPSLDPPLDNSSEDYDVQYNGEDLDDLNISTEQPLSGNEPTTTTWECKKCQRTYIQSTDRCRKCGQPKPT